MQFIRQCIADACAGTRGARRPYHSRALATALLALYTTFATLSAVDAAAASVPPEAKHHTQAEIVFETELGDIVIVLDQARAPNTTAYFLGYIQRGRYDGATLYRSAAFDGAAEPQLVQGGMLLDAVNVAGPIDPLDYGVDMLETIESTELTGLKHRRGAVSLARDLLDTGFVIPEIVFCLRAVPSMDAYGRDRPDTQGFPVFGHVVSGLEIVEAVTRRDLSGATEIPFLAGQILAEPVLIHNAYQRESKYKVVRESQ